MTSGAWGRFLVEDLMGLKNGCVELNAQRPSSSWSVSPSASISVKPFSLTGGGGDLSLSLLRGAKRGGGVGLFNRTLLFVISALGFGRGTGTGDEENISRMERVNLGLGSGGVNR